MGGMMMDGDMQEAMQQQYLFSAIQNGGAPSTPRQQAMPAMNPCISGMPINKIAFFQQYPMMALNQNCHEADMGDCCDDLMVQLMHAPRGPPNTPRGPSNFPNGPFNFPNGPFNSHVQREQAMPAANPCLSAATINKVSSFQQFPMMMANPNCQEA